MTTQNIPAQLFFLYDSHCPWSYVATKLVNEINQAFPAITLNLWHAAYFDGKNDGTKSAKINEIKEVEKLLNYRPIIKLNYNNPIEVLNNKCCTYKLNSALIKKH